MVFHGILWCSMETQLLNPEEFGMLFIGIGPFDCSKILMGR